MRRLGLLIAAVLLAVTVAVQVTASRDADRFVAAAAEMPTVASGVDVLAGIPEIPARIRGNDYRRTAFGEAWTDDNPAPGGHNECDTRNDILDRDLMDKTYTFIKRCPTAVATGTLHDPYTNAVVAFTRGNQIGASVQIDHIVPLALAWDLGARNWPDAIRIRFANDPANLLAVAGQANQDKGGWRARRVDAAQPCVLVPVRRAVRRRAARLRSVGRPTVGRRTSRRRRHVPDGVIVLPPLGRWRGPARTGMASCRPAQTPCACAASTTSTGRCSSTASMVAPSTCSAACRIRSTSSLSTGRSYFEVGGQRRQARLCSRRAPCEAKLRHVGFHAKQPDPASCAEAALERRTARHLGLRKGLPRLMTMHRRAGNL